MDWIFWRNKMNVRWDTQSTIHTYHHIFFYVSMLKVHQFFLPFPICSFEPLCVERLSKNWANLYKNWIQRWKRCPQENFVFLRFNFSRSFLSLRLELHLSVFHSSGPSRSEFILCAHMKKIMKLHCIVSYAPLAFDDVPCSCSWEKFCIFGGEIKVKRKPKKKMSEEKF